MKHISILILLLNSLISLAEYNGYHLEFNMNMKDGKVIHGYSYINGFYLENETMSHEEYLESNIDIVLRNNFMDGLGDFKFFKDRIKYDYTYDGLEKTSIYTLLHATSIDTSSIASLQIKSILDQSYAINISSFHQLRDTTWMKTRAPYRYSFGGMFCSNDIYVHENNSVVKSILFDLNEESNRIMRKLAELEEDLANVDGDEYYRIKDLMYSIEEESDERINEIIANLDGQKVVVITMCTC